MFVRKIIQFNSLFSPLAKHTVMHIILKYICKINDITQKRNYITPSLLFPQKELYHTQPTLSSKGIISHPAYSFLKRNYITPSLLFPKRNYITPSLLFPQKELYHTQPTLSSKVLQTALLTTVCLYYNLLLTSIQYSYIFPYHAATWHIFSTRLYHFSTHFQ